MLDEMYKKNLKEAMPVFSSLEFPEVLKACRELMGLKQYAASDYLGFENPRYKKLELGRFSEPIEPWEMERLEQFFQLPEGMLQKKQKDFLTKRNCDRKGVCQDVWSTIESARGIRAQRSEPNYKRVRGTL